MNLTFTKMHGCGNDYIYFNCLTQPIDNPYELAIKLSDRHFGIGGDGIVLICPSDIADAKMRMFNADGSEGKMCGNAIRCVGKYLYDNKIIEKTDIAIETLSGIKYLRLVTQDGMATHATVQMGKAELNPKKIPVALEGEAIVNRPVTIDGNTYFITCVSMGNPHCIVFCEDVDTLDLMTIGPKFEHAPLFPERINTEFVKVIDGNTIQMRVWERGSGETLACGTGACAAVVACVENGYCKKEKEITVKLVGGELKIQYTDTEVYMTGEAKTVFEGVVTI
jgi:diaminopimelate epimerase